MSRRFGWSLGREPLSPYRNMSSVPAVTDEDFSYITSQDLDNAGYYPRSHSTAPPEPEDDILLIKNKGVTYPAHFPAYTIGDGKLRVLDVKERVALMMDLPQRAARRIKLIYKGRQLKDQIAPVREYGVKNNSELMAVLADVQEASSPSEEEMVIVDAAREEPQDTKSKSKKSRKRGGKKKNKGDAGDGSSISASSPRASTSTLASAQSPPPPLAAFPAGPLIGPMKTLHELATEFDSKWKPLCDEYSAAPPSDDKKREEDHRKLSETIMQQIILKLDNVDSEGMPEVRARRKELVKHVQATLKKLDAAKDS